MNYKGNYVNGVGLASQHCESYDEFFNCRMVGTFNVELGRRWTELPTATTAERSYWFLTITDRQDRARYAWATCDAKSDQPDDILELLTKTPLEPSFTDGPVTITPWYRWTKETAAAWAKGQYWFQSWPWTPTQKADSQYVWDAIKPQSDWSGLRVLDIGGNAGFHAFRAAHAGAQATVAEPSDATRNQGTQIARHIEHQDVIFIPEDPGGQWDVILYLSVHHQIDPTYVRLAESLIELGDRAPLVLVELHVKPQDGDKPVDPYYTESEIDDMFSEKIVTYQSRVRGQRTVYRL